MPELVNQTAIRRARCVCLYDYLLSRHPADVELEGDSLRLSYNHSVSIRTGYAGFHDFADGSTGNAIECLTNFFGYTFQAAVAALCEYDGMTPEEISNMNPAMMSRVPLLAKDKRRRAAQLLLRTRPIFPVWQGIRPAGRNGGKSPKEPGVAGYKPLLVCPVKTRITPSELC